MRGPELTRITIHVHKRLIIYILFLKEGGRKRIPFYHLVLVGGKPQFLSSNPWSSTTQRPPSFSMVKLLNH